MTADSTVVIWTDAPAAAYPALAEEAPVRPCRKCGGTERYATGRRRCKACGKASSDAWRAANKEYSKAYYEANRDKALTRGGARYAANREGALAKHRVYYEANRESVLAKGRAWHKANYDSEKKSAQRRAWLKANPECAAARAAEHRERQRLRQSNWSKEAFEQAWTDQAGCCGICRVEMSKTGIGATSVTADHCHRAEKPRGLLCSKCNSGLGMLGDSLDLVRAAVAYLEKHA